MKIFAKRLKAEREALKQKDPKWTQEYIADLIGVARPTYTAYESGNKIPPMDTANKLADVFNITTDYLQGRTDKRRALDEDDMSEQEKAEFEAFINNPEYGIFFKDYLSAPEERRKEMWEIWRVLRESEKDRKPGQRQGE